MKKIDFADPGVPGTTIVRRADFSSYFNVSPKTVDDWRRAGKFPAPITPPGARPKWLLSDVRKYFDIKVRDDKASEIMELAERIATMLYEKRVAAEQQRALRENPNPETDEQGEGER